MYGSSFRCVTRRPRASRRAPTEALASPFPIEETTPPVTNTYFVGFRLMPGLPISTRVRSARGRERGSGVSRARFSAHFRVRWRGSPARTGMRIGACSVPDRMPSLSSPSRWPRSPRSPASRAKKPPRAAIALCEAVTLGACLCGGALDAAAADPAIAAPLPAQPAPAPPAPDVAPVEPGARPVRVGVLGGVGFPHPLSVEAMAQLYGVMTVGLEYGALPPITIDSVRASLWSVAGDFRVSPFRGSMSAFFIGARLGRQHVGAETVVNVPMLGSASEVLGLDSWFVN